MEQPVETLTALLPYLRRYARALTGSLERGDRLLTRAMEKALAAPDRYGRGRGMRFGLYRLFHELQHEGGGSRDAVHPLEAALAHLDEADRRLFLLTSLEELPLADAAQVLDITVDEAQRRLARARATVAGRLTANVLVVEDDAIIAFDLAETVRDMGHTVCGTAATIDEAMALVQTGRPTLALLDVRLAEGGSGITIARHLRQRQGVPVIFVTAFPDDLASQGLDGLGPAIPKPFTRDQIERAITCAVFAVPPQNDPAAVPAR